MRLERLRRRLRLLRRGLSALAEIYEQARSLRRVAGTLWFVGTRAGLIGLRHWLVRSAPTLQAELDPALRTLTYAEWLQRFDTLSKAELEEAGRHLATLRLPDLLILAVVTPGDVGVMERVIASWRTSIHPGWRAAVVPCGLSDADVRTLRGSIDSERRITLLTDAVEIDATRAKAGYTLLCRSAVLLNSLSIYMFLEAAVRTGADIVYADHDHVDEAGQRSAPAFKPQFSPEYLAHYNYIGDCVLLSRSIRFTPDDTRLLLDGDVTEYDRLIARLARNRQVEHLPFILSHLPAAQPHARHDVPVFPDTGPSVSIIIPTRDGLDYLKPCIDSIVERTSYDLDRVEVVVVDNDSREPETLAYLDALASIPNRKVIRSPGAFSFPEVNNAGCRASRGEILVFLNNDTVVRDPAWLSKLVGYAKQPNVGVVGAKLLFPDGTIQHGGCVAGGSMGTVQHLLSGARPEAVAATDHTREIALVTGACIALRREVFKRIGGFDPVLRITWNDTKCCLECLSAGLRNIYVADPLLVHCESKTRQLDNTREHYVRYFSEANYARRPFRDYFYDDPSYSPNLSLERAGELADPPRVRRPWFRPPGQKPRILLLSLVYKVGFGVPLVIREHALKLTELGYEVIIGGPLSENEFSFPGCERVALGSAKEAAAYAFRNGVALVISHTPPFFEVPILIGGHIPVLAYDYGEPPAEFFEEPSRSYLLNVGYQKRAAAALTTTIATISQAVKEETLNKDALVLGLANSHFPAWSEALRSERDRFRAGHGWEDAFVVLTVCRFHENERAYKGLDKIAAILREFPYIYPEQSKRVVWALAGAAKPGDVEQVERLGFTVFPNVSDELLADLYRAADAYVGFSKWEGYNLGISQALAMGLPTLGSDIPAHREFPIATTNSTLVACEWVAKQIELRTAAKPGRIPTVYEWERSTTAFAKVVADILRRSAEQPRRAGASGTVRADSEARPCFVELADSAQA